MIPDRRSARDPARARGSGYARVHGRAGLSALGRNPDRLGHGWGAPGRPAGPGRGSRLRHRRLRRRHRPGALREQHVGLGRRRHGDRRVAVPAQRQRAVRPRLDHQGLRGGRGAPGARPRLPVPHAGPRPGPCSPRGPAGRSRARRHRGLQLRPAQPARRHPRVHRLRPQRGGHAPVRAAARGSGSARRSPAAGSRRAAVGHPPRQRRRDRRQPAVHAVLRLAGRADRLDLGQREPDRHPGLPVVPGPARQGPLAAAHRGLPRRQPGEDDGPRRRHRALRRGRRPRRHRGERGDPRRRGSPAAEVRAAGPGTVRPHRLRPGARARRCPRRRPGAGAQPAAAPAPARRVPERQPRGPVRLPAAVRVREDRAEGQLQPRRPAVRVPPGRRGRQPRTATPPPARSCGP